MYYVLQNLELSKYGTCKEHRFHLLQIRWMATNDVTVSREIIAVDRKYINKFLWSKLNCIIL